MVCVILGNGFEEAEALVPVDLLRRAGIPVVLAGIDTLLVTGSHQITVQADCLLSQINPKEVELLFLPGGLGGVASMANSSTVTKLIQAVADRKGHLAAICAAPTLLASLGFLTGYEAVCYPGMEEQLAGAVVKQGCSVVTDRDRSTGEAAGSAFQFGLRLVELLRGREAAEQVRSAIHFHG